MNKKFLEMNRRNFLKLSAGSAATLGLLNIPMSAYANAGSFPDYKALVNIFFLGGNDGFNMIVPTSTFAYDEYAASRQNLAIAKADLLPISPASIGAGNYGLHPNLAEVQTLFNSGNLGIVANVGNLLQSVTKAQLEDPLTPQPRQLFSHNDQQDQWRYGDPATTKSGWGGRAADYIVGNNTTPLLSSVSISGRSNFLASLQNLDLSIGRNGFDKYSYVRPDRNWTQDRRAGFRALLDQGYSSPFINEFATTQKRTMDLVESVGGFLDDLADFTTVLPSGNNRLAQSLQMVAKLIAVREQLGMQRQVFYVAMGGFDTHDDQNTRQPALLTQISQALQYFNDVTTELGVVDQVTTFTSSEFGRTLTSNGDGTDHAWGNHQMVMGGAVNGGEIYGTMPSLEIGGPDDVRDDGRIIPTMSIEQYANPLLKWFGLSDSQIQTVIPNLSAFDANAVDFFGSS